MDKVFWLAAMGGLVGAMVISIVNGTLDVIVGHFWPEPPKPRLTLQLLDEDGVPVRTHEVTDKGASILIRDINTGRYD